MKYKNELNYVKQPRKLAVNKKVWRGREGVKRTMWIRYVSLFILKDLFYFNTSQVSLKA